MRSIQQINQFLQSQLRAKGLTKVTAVVAARWLDEAGILKDSKQRRGKPLRDLLRAGQIVGSYQLNARYWYIKQTNLQQTPTIDRDYPRIDSPVQCHTDTLQSLVEPDESGIASVTVSDLLTRAALEISGSTQWGTPIPADAPGIYIISTSTNPSSEDATHPQIPVCMSALDMWLQRVRNLSLHGEHPSPGKLSAELSRFWLPDQTIVYIGKASGSLRKRVGQFYSTRLGDRRPHAGGSWIKALSILDDLTIHWALTDSPECKEQHILHLFGHVCAKSETDHPMPFGNLETYRLQSNSYVRIRKLHWVKDWKLSD